MGKDRVWYNSKISRSKAEEFLRKYRVFDYDVFVRIAKEGDLKEFKLLCNVIGTSLLYGMTGSMGSYDKIYELRAACNERVKDRMGGEASKLFELFSKSQNHEYWLGDERYKLYSFDFGSYADRQVIKSVVAYMAKYNGKEIGVDDVKNIGFLYNNGLYWELYDEDLTNSDWENDDAVFIRVNKDRKKHLDLWSEFMRYVWDRKWDKAYDLMVRWQSKTGREGWDYI